MDSLILLFLLIQERILVIIAMNYYMVTTYIAQIQAFIIHIIISFLSFSILNLGHLLLRKVHVGIPSVQPDHDSISSRTVVRRALCLPWLLSSRQLAGSQLPDMCHSARAPG